MNAPGRNQGRGGGTAAPFHFADAEAEHFRLEALLHQVERRPLFSDADHEKADAEAQAIVNQQLALEEAAYSTPAATLADVLVKARFLRRNADADLPEDLTAADAYSYQPQFGERLPRGVASLWADLERLAAPRAISDRDRRLLAIRREWEAATAEVNAPGRDDAESEKWSERQVALEREAFSIPADSLAGMAVKAAIAFHNTTGGTCHVTPDEAYAGVSACLDEHASLSLWADISRLAGASGVDARPWCDLDYALVSLEGAGAAMVDLAHAEDANPDGLIWCSLHVRRAIAEVRRLFTAMSPLDREGGAP